MGRLGTDKNAHSTLIAERKGKRTFGIPGGRCKDNIGTDVK
jgi:hypothetical protein